LKIAELALNYISLTRSKAIQLFMLDIRYTKIVKKKSKIVISLPGQMLFEIFLAFLRIWLKDPFPMKNILKSCKIPQIFIPTPLLAGLCFGERWAGVRMLAYLR
jgi:hypothetical protein